MRPASCCAATAAAVAAVVVGALVAAPDPSQLVPPVGEVVPTPGDPATLHPTVRAYLQRPGARFVSAFGRRVFTVDIPCAAAPHDGGKCPTVVLVHGFPTSSQDFEHALPHMAQHARVVTFDLIGFGLSDKPASGYSYSLHDQAETMLEVLRQLGVTKAHIVCHDMGDSVVTELLARLERGMVNPGTAPDVQSVTFTNGGMRVELINMRVSQSALLTPRLGPAFTLLVNRLGVMPFVFRKQVSSIWGKRAPPSQEQLDTMIAGIEVNGGTWRLPQMFYYLRDRITFQPRWMESLARLRVPWRLLWADSDDVSPMSIPCTVLADMRARREANGDAAADVGAPPHVEYLPGLGHWAMVEAPKEWAHAVMRAALGQDTPVGAVYNECVR